MVVDALAALRSADREVLLLSAWEGLPASQIAERFGISTKAAEKRLSRAKQRLASQLSRVDQVSVNTPHVMQEGGGS